MYLTTGLGTVFSSTFSFEKKDQKDKAWDGSIQVNLLAMSYSNSKSDFLQYLSFVY